MVVMLLLLLLVISHVTSAEAQEIKEDEQIIKKELRLVIDSLQLQGDEAIRFASVIKSSGDEITAMLNEHEGSLLKIAPSISAVQKKTDNAVYALLPKSRHKPYDKLIHNFRKNRRKEIIQARRKDH